MDYPADPGGNGEALLMQSGLVRMLRRGPARISQGNWQGDFVQLNVRCESMNISFSSQYHRNSKRKSVSLDVCMVVPKPELGVNGTTGLRECSRTKGTEDVGTRGVMDMGSAGDS